MYSTVSIGPSCIESLTEFLHVTSGGVSPHFTIESLPSRFFNNLNPSFVTGNKLSWKTIKPFFYNKGNYGSQIKLVEKDEVLQGNDLIVKELNKFFKNSVSTLNIKENKFITNRSSGGITGHIDKAIYKYKFHSTILLIRKHLINHDVFFIQNN